jgi:hypothetical protein
MPSTPSEVWCAAVSRWIAAPSSVVVTTTRPFATHAGS